MTRRILEVYRGDDADGGGPARSASTSRTSAVRRQPAKRVLMLDASARRADHLYGAIEVGGAIRSTDGGERGKPRRGPLHQRRRRRARRPWRAAGAGRHCSSPAGMWKSADGGDHWTRIPAGTAQRRGQISSPRHPRGARRPAPSRSGSPRQLELSATWVSFSAARTAATGQGRCRRPVPRDVPDRLDERRRA